MLPRRKFLTGLAISAGTLSSYSSIARSPADRPIPAPGRHGTALSPQDLEDALVGSSYLGTGGGGSLEKARELIASDLEAGLEFSSIPVGVLRDDDRIACPYGLASLAPTDAAMQARLDGIENKVGEPVEAAFRVLENHLGQKMAAVIMGEIGPLSLAEGLSTAARLGIPALDADTVGRAVPEINQHSVKVAGIPLTPIGAATPFGDEMVVGRLGDPTRAEDILRSVAVASRVCGVADSPISGAQAKQEGTLVTGSLTLARSIGAAVRTARRIGRDPIEAARAAADGYLLFRGRVTDFSWRDEDGFLVGDLTLSGMGEFAGQKFTTDYKNEHLVARHNGAIVATCPDLISVVDLETYDGVNNPDFTRGQEVAVLGFRCDPLWRSEAGLAVFSPRYFGYDIDYVPIEQRLA